MDQLNYQAVKTEDVFLGALFGFIDPFPERRDLFPWMQSKVHLLVGMLAICLLLSGCGASYRSSPLAALDPEYVRSYPGAEGLVIGCRAYSKEDCYNYLDRDVIRKKYQPLQLTFHNTTNKSYVFSSKRVSLPCVDPKMVAKAVHTSTAARVVGFGVGSLFYWPLAINAVIDGMQSHFANKRLDKDFLEKAREYFVVRPKGFEKTLIFVPVSETSSAFDIIFFETETESDKVVKIFVPSEAGDQNSQLN